MPAFGQIIALLTFPGVIMHEVVHQMFCRRFRVAVFDVCYFRYGTPAGDVVHEPPGKLTHSIWIGVGPFLVSTALGALIAMPGAIPLVKFGTASVPEYISIWLGISIAMHSFPSTGDAKAIWQAAWSEDVPAWVGAVSIPPVGIVYLGALASAVSLNLLYGAAVAFLIPNLLVSLFA